MAHKNLAFKKKLHFLQLIKDLPPDRILFCPIDVSKHFHVALFHDIHCQPLSDFFEFSASNFGFASFIERLEEAFARHSPQLVLIGMEPTSVYDEGLLHHLRRRSELTTSPHLQLCIVDPAAIKDNRQQHSLRTQKSDQIDAAAIGELLTRGLYTPAHFSSPQAVLVKEVARSLNAHRQQMLALWNRLSTRVDRVFPNLLLNYQSVHLRNAIYKMTCSVIWHEPTFGIPCFQRLINRHPFVPTILHVGRKLTSTALAILKTDRAFHSPLAGDQGAKEKLVLLQQQYLKQKKQTASRDQK